MEAESKPLWCTEMREYTKYIPPHITGQVLSLANMLLWPFIQAHSTCNAFKVQCPGSE